MDQSKVEVFKVLSHSGKPTKFSYNDPLLGAIDAEMASLYMEDPRHVKPEKIIINAMSSFNDATMRQKVYWLHDRGLPSSGVADYLKINETTVTRFLKRRT